MASKIFSMLKLLLQVIASNQESIASKLLATCMQDFSQYNDPRERLQVNFNIVPEPPSQKLVLF